MGLICNKIESQEKTYLCFLKHKILLYETGKIKQNKNYFEEYKIMSDLKKEDKNEKIR